MSRIQIFEKKNSKFSIYGFYKLIIYLKIDNECLNNIYREDLHRIYWIILNKICRNKEEEGFFTKPEYLLVYNCFNSVLSLNFNEIHNYVEEKSCYTY